MSIEIVNCIKGIKNTQCLIVISLSPFFTIQKEVLKIRESIAFDTLNEVYEYYDNNVVSLVNLKQIGFYGLNAVQPDWVEPSPYNKKLVAYYGQERTKEVWERWKRTTASKMENNISEA